MFWGWRLSRLRRCWWLLSPTEAISFCRRSERLVLYRKSFETGTTINCTRGRPRYLPQWDGDDPTERFMTTERLFKMHARCFWQSCVDNAIPVPYRTELDTVMSNWVGGYNASCMCPRYHRLAGYNTTQLVACFVSIPDVRRCPKYRAGSGNRQFICFTRKQARKTHATGDSLKLANASTLWTRATSMESTWMRKPSAS